MSPELVRNVAGYAVVALGSLVWYVGYLWWWNPERRRADVERWSMRHMAAWDARWQEPIERQLKADVRVDLIWVFLLCGVLQGVPTSGKAYVACLVAIPGVVTTFNGLAFTRIPLPPGTRVARLRELTLTDYLPDRTRWLMWASAAAGCLACVVLGAATGRWVVGASGGLLLLMPLTVEYAGSRLAHLPEPADSAALLYVQDAFRSDIIRSAAVRSSLGAAIASVLVAWALVVEHPGWVPVVLLGVGGLLVVCLCLQGSDFRHTPAAYMRSRLWPALTPHQVIRPGDALPVPATVSSC